MGYNYCYKIMKEALILEHKTFISAKRAAEVSGYASDYVGQLCRAGKLECKMVGRSWFVTEESLRKHQLSVLEDTQDEVASLPVVVPKKEETLVLEVPVIPTPVIEVAPVQEPAPVFNLVPEPVRVSFVPHSFALPYTISQAYLFAPTYRKSFPSSSDSSFPFIKLTFAAGVFAIAFFFMFQTMLFPTQSSNKVSSSAAASVVSAAQEITSKILSFFTAIPELARTVFTKRSNVVVKTEPSPPEFNGLAVVPSSDSVDQDEVIKQKIRDSFSDEIQIRPDESGTSGVITPVFRKAKGDDFIYVLVPVQGQ
ncbi:MAG: trimeric autotransporter adhesin [Patescibacteria group bacterium]|nr:trimeric autotransporter adhesin [Patescibacteria group bacterium]